jgi:DNA-binding response OmpR family regulator
MRILVIDDDELLVESLRTSLETESYAVDCAFDGERGSFLARTCDYDIIILDNILPKKSGLKVCEELRNLDIPTPIIMLSVKNDSISKTTLLNSGADDYLTKPFSFKELQARIKAVLRRPKVMKSDILKIDNLIVDTAKQQAKRGKTIIYLTRKEFSLLEYLLRQKGNVVSRGMIMEHVWNIDTDPFSNTIEAHILNLRKKIESPKQKKLIHNVPGRGYKIDIE